MTWYLPACLCACMWVVCVSGHRVAQSCCTQLYWADLSAVCNSVFIILFLYMIILILIVNIPCIFAIIYMHYQRQITVWLNFVWWFWFIVFHKLFSSKIVTWSYTVQFLAIWNVGFFCCCFFKLQPEMFLQPEPTGNLAFFCFCFFVLLSCVPDGLMKAGHLLQYIVYGDGSLYS